MTRVQKIACAIAALTLITAAAIGTHHATRVADNRPVGAAGHALTLPTPTPTVEPEPVVDTPTQAEINQTTFLTVTNNKIHDQSDAVLLDAGWTTCGTLDQTAYPTTDTLVGIGLGMASRYGWTMEQAGTVVGAAVSAFCPQHEYLIP